ncbi:MAG: triple tyrosine motif-containing protein, partial [Saprospiraceae bacterium]
QEINTPESILGIQYLSNNQFWFYTARSVVLYDLNREEAIHYLSLPTIGLAQKYLSFIVADDHESVWLSYRNGLSYYNFAQQEHLRFGAKDGLKAIGSIRKLLRLQTGEIAMGTNNGMYIFAPKQLLNQVKQAQQEALKTPLVLTNYSVLQGATDSLFQFDYLYQSNPTIYLDYNDKMLEFEYALLHFTEPDAHLYSYQLEGFDSQWSPPTTQYRARYTSLPAGNYTFKAKASTGNGLWSEQELHIPIVVHEA